jgi:16S rRNA (guanine966-N2)-methyltransferase
MLEVSQVNGEKNRGMRMRVVGGSAKGTTLSVVPGEGTRPILDRVKTALFDILRPRIEEVDVLDLFAGSGGVGIEALSQGAAFCTFLDLGARAVATIKKNLVATGFTERSEVRLVDALVYLRTTKKAFDLIYVAPPQYRKLWIQAVRLIDARPELLRSRDSCEEDFPDPLIIVQIDPKEYESLDLASLSERRQKRYGNTLLVFFEPTSDGNADEEEDEDGNSREQEDEI